MKSLGAPNYVEPEYNGPTNFYWLVSGLLGGSPRPGIFKEDYRDLEALARLKIRLLVTLTEEWTPDIVQIKQYGMDSLYVPIADLAPPTIEQAMETCQQVYEYTRRGEAVVFHCRAGKGRTGTMLAATQIWAGQTSAKSIEQARSCNRHWIESDSQLVFLTLFQDFCEQHKINRDE